MENIHVDFCSFTLHHIPFDGIVFSFVEPKIGREALHKLIIKDKAFPANFMTAIYFCVFEVNAPVSVKCLALFFEVNVPVTVSLWRLSSDF